MITRAKDLEYARRHATRVRSRRGVGVKCRSWGDSRGVRIFTLGRRAVVKLASPLRNASASRGGHVTTTATRYELRNTAAWITLDSPENRNALSAPLVARARRASLQAADRRSGGARDRAHRQRSGVSARAPISKNRGDAVAPGAAARIPFVEILRADVGRAEAGDRRRQRCTRFGGGVGLIAAADIAIAVDSRDAELQRGPHRASSRR